MIKKIEFESLNLCQFRVVGIAKIDTGNNVDFLFEFHSKRLNNETDFYLTPEEIDSLIRYRERCLADIGR